MYIPTLPDGLVSILRECCEFFENNGIRHWLGGGLFQCIKEGRFDEIQQSWEHRTERGKGHDVDFYITASDIYRVKERVEDLVRGLDYKIVSDDPHKLVLRKNSQEIEFVYIFPAPVDNKVVYFLGWGKKELWRSSGLSENLRQRLYCHSLPKEVFGNDNMTIDGLNIGVSSDIYLKLLYPSHVVSRWYRWLMFYLFPLLKSLINHKNNI